ncbi:hypothetical protein MKX01_000199 [Papaver californicum]|nr:hypothetical protein MKX01_000199 [Papaver californicum]
MASRMMVLLIVVAAATVLQCATAQTSHVVGDSLGWIIPASTSVYSTWASKQTFKVGDSLVFNFASGLHTTAEVSKADYDSCNSAATPIGSLLASSPATIRLATAGNHYYICTVGGHCSAGQKLSINVASAMAAAPTPVATPTPVASPVPTPVASPIPSPSTSPVSTPAMSPDMSPSPSTSAVTPSSGPAPASTSTSGNGAFADSPTAGSTPAAAPPSNSAISVAVSGLSLVALLSAFFM